MSSLSRKSSTATQCDLEDGEYVVFFGTFPGATGKSFQGIAKRVFDSVKKGTLTVDVLDPVLGNGCVTPAIKGVNWIPIRPATNAAFSCAAAQWMLENDKVNIDFLSIPNYPSALSAGFASFTNATHLVIVDEAHKNYRRIMRSADAGIPAPQAAEGSTATPDDFVVIDSKTGEPSLYSDCEKAQLEFEGEVNGVKVRSAFLILKDNIYERSIEEYSEICGVPQEVIERIAANFAAHGTRSSGCAMGGTATTNGTDGTFAYRVLNAFVGSEQMTGGCNVYRQGGKTTTDGARYKLSTVKGKPAVSAKTATYISRSGKAWTKTDEYANRVAAGEKDPKPKLPWFSISYSADNQALMSIVNQYPYQAKILVSWMTNTLQVTPGAMRDDVIERLCDPSVVPLHIACDVFIGEHARLADYIVPDTTPYESFGVVTNEGYWRGRGNSVRWQAKRPETIEISGGRHASFEAFCVDVAKACGVPGFGENAIEGVDGTTWPFNDASDFFLKAVANLAYDTSAVDDISESEIKLQALDELPESWERSVTAEEWPKVLKVLSRGGRFWPIESSQKNGRSAYAKEFQSYLYSEPKAINPNSYSDVMGSGSMRYVPDQLSDRTPITELFSSEEFPFALSNYKARFRSVTMQANSPIMRSLCEKNYLEINAEDAAELGIEDGDKVRISTPTGEFMEGEAWVRAGIARKSFGIAFGYGHRAWGAQDVDIDGNLSKGNPAIAAGVHLETMRDPTLGEGVIYPIADNDSTTPGRNGGMYKIEKA